MWQPSVSPVKGKALATTTSGAADETAQELKCGLGPAAILWRLRPGFSLFSFPLIADKDTWFFLVVFHCGHDLMFLYYHQTGGFDSQICAKESP